MKRFISFIVLLATLVSVAPLCITNAAESTEAHSKIYYRGVNLSGPESAGHILPGVEGTNYTFGEEKIFAYLERKGFDIARVPVLWERLQHSLSGPLDTAYVDGLKRNAEWAEKHNMKIIIDLHNYGKYNGEFIGVEGSNVSVADYEDLWSKLSAEFKGNKGIYAYDIMNEPTFADYKDWHTASQAAVDAIRANEDTTLIYVEGNFWGHCEHWTTLNGEEPWITDPYDNTSYSAHCYFDTDTSGSYKLSFDEQLKETPDLLEIGTKRVTEFGEWCQKYNLKGYIGEFGAPYRDDSKNGDWVQSTRWSDVMDTFLTAIDSYGMDATVWAAGHWWGNGNILNVYPTNAHMNPLSGDSVHMPTLTNHLSNKEDYSAFKFGSERVFEGEYGVIDGDGKRVSSSSVSNGKYVSLPASSSLDFCRINASNAGEAILKITYMARNESPRLNVSINNKLSKEIELTKTTGFSDYETIIKLNEGENSIIFQPAEDSSTVFIDKISITLLTSPRSIYTSTINADIIKINYTSTYDIDTFFRINGEIHHITLPSTNYNASEISFDIKVSKQDLLDFSSCPSTETTLINRDILKNDGKKDLDTPASIDRFASAVVQRNTADFNNDDDEIWGYKGYDGNMKNWNVEKMLRDGSSTDRYYRTSFEETGTYGTMKSAHMNLPLGQGNMWELSNFKYVTMDIRSNTDVAIRLYQNGPDARETNSGMMVADTKGEWTTVTIPIEAFMSDWLYDNFTRTSSRTNYVIFYPSFTDGGSAYRYFDIDNISFNWTDKQVGFTSISFADENNNSINTSGLKGGKTKLIATIKNTKDIDADKGDANVIVTYAVYDKVTGNLVDMTIADESVKPNGSVDVVCELTVPDNSLDRYETRTLLWDKDTLEPITEVYKF